MMKKNHRIKTKNTRVAKFYILILCMMMHPPYKREENTLTSNKVVAHYTARALTPSIWLQSQNE